jgi:aminoglycoside phosphotransferase (APT) family kinase protein
VATPLPAPIGIGRTAEVFLGESAGTVVKLLRLGFDPADLTAEAAKAAAAVAAGAPAPAVHGLVELAGRPGLVMDRVEGASMLARVIDRPHRVRRFGASLGSTHARILACRPTDLPSVADRLGGAIDRAELPTAIREPALGALADLPDGDALLHGDLHPDNVFGSPDDPVVIDWVDASVGDPAADVARTVWLLSADAIPLDQPRRRLAVALVGLLRRSYLQSVTGAIGLTGSEIDRWRLPVLAARVAEGIEHEREPLLAELARLAGSYG